MVSIFGSLVVLVGKRQTTDPTCEEALPSACADIVAADASVCNNDCLATRCPVACGRCSKYILIVHLVDLLHVL